MAKSLSDVETRLADAAARAAERAALCIRATSPLDYYRTIFGLGVSSVHCSVGHTGDRSWKVFIANMSLRSRRLLGLVPEALLVGALVVPGSALAHERRTIDNGKYNVGRGWDVEPRIRASRTRPAFGSLRRVRPIPRRRSPARKRR